MRYRGKTWVINLKPNLIEFAQILEKILRMEFKNSKKEKKKENEIESNVEYGVPFPYPSIFIFIPVFPLLLFF